MSDYKVIDDNTTIKLLKNCMYVEKNSEGIMPYRFTKQQLDKFKDDEFYKIRTHCTSGICLDFYTDSSAFIMQYGTYLGPSRDWLYFDVYINDVLYERIGNRPISEACGELRFNIAANSHKMNHITIYLPHTVSLIIKEIRVDKYAYIRRKTDMNTNLLCLGDSITQGMDAIGPSSTYPVQLARALGMNLINQGIGGHIFDEQSLDPFIALKPDIITVAYGTNDWNKVSDGLFFREEVQKYLEKLMSIFEQSSIYVITPLWREQYDFVKPMGTLVDVMHTIKQVCTLYPRIKMIDGFNLIPNDPDYFTDGLHPNEDGFRVYKRSLLEHLKMDVGATLRLNIEKLHTTPMGLDRIRKNLCVHVEDLVSWSKDKIADEACRITRKGKNYYAQIDGCIFTVNAHSYTIITAHKAD